MESFLVDIEHRISGYSALIPVLGISSPVFGVSLTQMDIVMIESSEFIVTPCNTVLEGVVKNNVIEVPQNDEELIAAIEQEKTEIEVTKLSDEALLFKQEVDSFTTTDQLMQLLKSYELEIEFPKRSSLDDKKKIVLKTVIGLE